jgi:hypothetical protein
MPSDDVAGDVWIRLIGAAGKARHPDLALWRFFADVDVLPEHDELSENDLPAHGSRESPVTDGSGLVGTFRTFSCGFAPALHQLVERWLAAISSGEFPSVDHAPNSRRAAAARFL